MTAKTLEIKGEHKVLSKKKGSHLAFFRYTCTGTKRDLIFFFDINFYKLFAYSSKFINIERVISPNCIKFTFSSAILLYCYQAACVMIHTHTDFISPCNKKTIQSDPNVAKTQSYNVKHFQALKLKSKHFSDLENTTLKFKHFQGFQAPVRTLCIYIYTYMHIFTK